MAAVTSDIHICNLALDRIGQVPIVSIATPTTGPEDVCARHYDTERRVLLRRFIFNFAKKYVVLTADEIVEPAFGFSAAYRFPNDFVRLLALGDISLVNGDLNAHLYDLAEGYIYTDHGDDDGLKMQYVFDAKTVAKFDALFVDLFRLQLAKAISYKFTLKSGLVKQLDDELEAAAIAAAAVAGQEKPPRRIQRSRLREVRRAGGLFRDNTRI